MRNILIVDDSPLMRKLMQSHLGGFHDVNVVQSSTVEDALAQIGRISVALVVTDLLLGDGRSGAELVQKIRLERSNENLPIVVMSADGNSADAKNAMEWGANAFLEKPFSKNVLLDCVGKFLASQG